jgi:hypothetical protein
MQAILAKVVAFIGGVTLLSGIVQALAPAAILGPLQAEVTPTSAHFFRLVGMFMALFGGLLLQSYRRQGSAAFVPIIWCGCQKVGAVLGVVSAVAMHLFSGLALAVALFDLVSALVLFQYARGIVRDAAVPGVSR